MFSIPQHYQRTNRAVSEPTSTTTTPASERVPA